MDSIISSKIARNSRREFSLLRSDRRVIETRSHNFSPADETVKSENLRANMLCDLYFQTGEIRFHSGEIGASFENDGKKEGKRKKSSLPTVGAIEIRRRVCIETGI